MEIKIIYPVRKHPARFWKICCKIYTIAFLISLFLCPFLNFLFGGKPWSLIVVVSSFIVWTSFISPSLFELNRTTQSIKLFLNILLLLLSIDIVTEGGWGFFVIPIVSFGELTVSTTLFFSDFERQRHNALPFLFVTIVALTAGILGVFSTLIVIRWPFIVLASFAFAVLVTSIILLQKTVILDIKKQFNTK